MSIDGIDNILRAQRASLRLIGEDLVLRGPRAALEDAQLRAQIEANRTNIIEQIRHGSLFGLSEEVIDTPPNLIAPNCERITPELLPLINLTQEEIDRVVAQVPAGTRNVQDIYPLAPLQEGILFHHLTAPEGDPYRLWSLMSFKDRDALDAYVGALNAVIARHDILRTAILWEGLREPVQVVWRQAPLVVEDVNLGADVGDVAGQLRRKFHPRQYRMDITQAPMMRMCVAWDVAHSRWLGIQLSHHLALDRAAAGMMNSEVRMYMAGRMTELSQPSPFRKFVAQTRVSASSSEHEVFFRKLLGDVDEPTAPFGLVDVLGDGAAIAEASATLSSDLSSRVRVRARLLRVSVASLFHVAWGQILARASGRDNPVFGTAVLGRMKGVEGVDRVLGPFLNALPVLIRLSNVTVEECVRETHQLLSELVQHEHASLVLVQRCSKVRSPAPLFTAILNYRNNGSVGVRHAGEIHAPISGIDHLASDVRNNYPLTLAVDDVEDGFNLNVQVDASVDPERICAMVTCTLERLVTALGETPAHEASKLDVLPLQERHRLLVGWNNTATWYPEERCIHELFEEQAYRTPDAIAIVHEDRKLNYRELDRRSNQLAHYLISLGVGPEVIVGLCLQRSLDMVVGLIGILKAGAACLPLDPSFPAQRLSFMLQDAAVRTIISNTSFAISISQCCAPTVLLDDCPALAEQPDTRPGVSVTQLNLAYVVYTSGSTGHPKGVLVLHRAIVNRLYAERHRSGADCVYAQKTTINFIDVLWEVFMPLISGGISMLIPPEDVVDPLRFVKVLRLKSITHLVLVPSLLKETLAGLLIDGESLPDLRYCACSGETLPIDIAGKFKAQLPAVEFVNIYGTSEFWDATAHCVNPAELGTTVLIGRPITNMKVYVLDERLAFSPIRVAGEIYVVGDGLARGYIGQREVSAQKFIACPFDPTRRMYRSGDRGRWRADGQLEFLGRSDEQVKIRGHRVEPGEIEVTLRSYAGISQVAVVPLHDDDETSLIAYVVPSSRASASGAAVSDGVAYSTESTIREKDLKAYLRGRLPEFMIPIAFVVVEAIPLTPSGKIDRMALPTPGCRRDSRASYVAPRNHIEEEMSRVWASILKLDRVGIDDNFFELGGNSIAAIRMINQLRPRMGVKLSFRAVFEKQTIASICESLTMPKLRGGALPQEAHNESHQED